MSVSFIPPVPQDAAALTAIAVSSKAHWGYPDHWIREWLPQLNVSSEFIATHRVIAVHVNQRLIGFYALSDQTVSDLVHFWLMPSSLGW